MEEVIANVRTDGKTRKLPCEDTSNDHRGAAFLAWEFWKHLPLWYSVGTIVLWTILAVMYFSPSRHLMTVTAIFPLVGITLYLYARFSTDPTRKTGALKLALAISGTLIAIIIALNLFLSPVWNSDVVIQVKQFYPHAQIDKNIVIKDSLGNPVRDAKGVPLTKNKMMTAPDGRQYKVEGMLLINLEYKDKLVTLYEIWCIFWLILLIAHCWYWRGGKGVAIFFVVASIFGFLLESGGVAGDYFRESNYHYYLPGLAAPVATMVGWPMILYTAIFMYEMIAQRWTWLKTANIIFPAAIISLLATCWDMNVDPGATNLGFWTWHEMLPGVYFNVPMLNMIGWLDNIFFFALLYIFVMRRAGWSDRKKIMVMFLLFLPALVALTVGTFFWLGLIEGTTGPCWKLLGLAK